MTGPAQEFTAQNWNHPCAPLPRVSQPSAFCTWTSGATGREPE
jgi:hypothetical protein